MPHHLLQRERRDIVWYMCEVTNTGREGRGKEERGGGRRGREEGWQGRERGKGEGREGE